MTNSSEHKSLSFPQAIAKTQLLMEQISSNQLNEAEVRQNVSSLLATKNGGRGFFVAYLTSDIPLADHPTVGVLEGLKSAAEISSELLVKNLAMSSAMMITHRQNNDLENLAGSQTVCRRTCNLIKQLNMHEIAEKLQKLHCTIKQGQGEYQEFLEHWRYNQEQQQAIQETIDQLNV